MKKILILLIVFFALNLSKANATYEEDLRALFPEMTDATLDLYKSFEKDDLIDHIVSIKESFFKDDCNGDKSFSLLQFFVFISFHFRFVSKSEFLKNTLWFKDKEFDQIKAINAIIHYFTNKVFNLKYARPNITSPKNPEWLKPSIRRLKELFKTANLNDEGTFLIPNKNLNESPLEIFNEFAEKLKEYSIDPEENIPFFADLASYYLHHFLATGNFLKQTEMSSNIVVTHLIMDILFAYINREANYKWFLNINKKMLIISELSNKYIDSVFNTSFDSYLYYYYINFYKSNEVINNLGRQDFFDKSINNFGNIHTIKRCAPQRLINLYPYIFLHFPFKLSKEDLIKSLFNGDLSFCPLGFAFSNVAADGRKEMSPPEFELHDVQHFNILQNMSTFAFDVTGYKDLASFYDPNFVNQLKNHVKEGLILLGEWAAHIKDIVNKQENDLLKEYFSFFGFLIIHEHRFGLSQRLEFSTLKDEFKLFTLRKPIKDLFNEDYYLSLLPKEIQDLDDNQKRQEIIEKQIDAFFDALQTEQSSQLKARISNWLKKYDPSKPLKEHIIHFDPLAYKTNIHPASEENIKDCKQYTYTIKIPKKTNDLIPFDQLEIVQSIKALIPNEDPYETKTILRYVFNDILPDGKEVRKISSDGQKIPADDWIEKFVVEPADIEFPTLSEAESYANNCKKLLFEFPTILEAEAYAENCKKLLAELFGKKN